VEFLLALLELIHILLVSAGMVDKLLLLYLTTPMVSGYQPWASCIFAILQAIVFELLLLMELLIHSRDLDLMDLLEDLVEMEGWHYQPVASFIILVGYIPILVEMSLLLTLITHAFGRSILLVLLRHLLGEVLVEMVDKRRQLCCPPLQFWM
jgi:hypothetical protein